MKYNNWTTEKLETRDEAITRTLRALKAWSNRSLSRKDRLTLVEALREEQNAIMNELIKREVAA